MREIKVWHSSLLVIFCIFLVSCTANSQTESPKVVRTEVATTSQSKQELARQVLAETGISQIYDLHMANSLDMALPDTTNNSKFREWLQEVVVRGAGWSKIEDKYIARLEANFSESELKELLNLSKQPLMKKLLQNQILAYGDASTERRKRMFKLWEEYQAGKLIPPPEARP